MYNATLFLEGGFKVSSCCSEKVITQLSREKRDEKEVKR